MGDKYVMNPDNPQPPPGATEPMNQALGAVVAYYNAMNRSQDDPIDGTNVHLVWFAKTLENWKAMVITTQADKLFFEVTHSGANKNTCIDVYDKIDSMMIDDSTWL